MATIEELGAVVTFLCSPLSGYTTGTIITVDGGASSRRA
jgi:enoyl-[acyl-carrier-protein] reductase (NADH)